MRKLLIYLNGYRRETVLAPFFKLLEAFLELLVPLVMAKIIDVGIGGSDRGYVVRMGGWLLLLGAVGLAFSVTAQFFAAKAAAGFSVKLREALFGHLLELDFTEMDQIGASAMITRMTSDVNQVQSGVNMVLRLFLRSPVVVLGAMVMAFSVDWKSALVFAAVIPLLSVVVFGLLFHTIPLYRKVQEALDRVLGLTRENLTGVRVIRAFHKEAAEEERFRQRNRAYASLQLFVGKISAFLNPATYVLVNGALLALLSVGAVQVDTGNLTQGEVVALVNYLSQILIELVKLANLLITITKALACADRVAAVLERGGGAGKSGFLDEAEGGETGGGAYRDGFSGVPPPFLSFEHVSLTYDGAGAESLRDIHFTVQKGETIGIIGGTGSGKTSLVNLIPRFYPVTKGSLKLEGVDVRSLPEEEIRLRIGIVPQKAVLFQGTIRSNLRWGKEDVSEEQLWAALEQAQAREIAEGKPGGLDAEVAQNGMNFSGGQRQRLTIARALLRKPEILILDDSSSALDYATDSRLRAALRKMGNTTIFMVSQRTSAIRCADRIVVLEDGEMAGCGTHEQLLESCKVYQEIAGQTEGEEPT
jgi:ABC-type multidrug transport system fused ATPase/permease subunit